MRDWISGTQVPLQVSRLRLQRTLGMKRNQVQELEFVFDVVEVQGESLVSHNQPVSASARLGWLDGDCRTEGSVLSKIETLVYREVCRSIDTLTGSQLNRRMR